MNVQEKAELYDVIARKLQSVDTSFQKSTQKVLPEYGSYHEAAAVLSSFEPEKIKPVLKPSPESVEDLEAVEDLIVSSFLIYDDQRKPRWTLQAHIRREVIKQLGTRENLKKALGANPERPNDSVQRMLEAYLNDYSPELSRLATTDLTAICQILEWFEKTEVLNNLPTFGEVNNRLSFLRLIEPLQKLVGDHFSGREKQLQAIQDYVGVSLASANTKATSPDFGENSRLKPPLMIYGPGGVGKSTLIAKYILEYIAVGGKEQFPFAYLDFDRRGLLPEEPATLMVEIIRQLGIQFPAAQESLDRLRQDLQNQLASAARESENRRQLTDKYALIWDNESYRNHFLNNFDALLQTLKIKSKPFLIVLDTFEEVQMRSRQHISQLWTFLEQFREIAPGLRVILSGRARLKDYPIEPLQISDFDEEAAEGFLIHKKVKPLALAKEIVKRVGGSPLSLRLALQIFEKEKGESTQFFQHLLKNQIQGQLYTRILEHIEDQDVRKLAHPGLILRLITKEIILNVLAAPCGVKVENPADAERLFDKLAEDVTLVVPDTESKDALRHIPEVRRLMVKLLPEDAEKKSKIIEIQNSVIAYYEKFAEPIYRAEEIYHRLALKQDHKLIAERWIKGVELYLYNALEELEPPEQAFLASRLGIDLDDGILALSSQEDWEKITESRIGVMLQQNEIEKALAMLGERTERLPASRLYLLEAKAYELKGYYNETLRLVREALSQTLFNDYLNIELLMLGAKTLMRLRNFQEAGAYLQMARESASIQNNKWRFFEATLELLAAREHLPELNLREEWFVSLAKDLVSQILKEQRGDETVLLRKIVGVYGKDNQEILLQAVNFMGFEGASQNLLRDLARAVTDWDLQYSSNYDESGFLTRAAGVAFHGDIYDAWLILMAKESPVKIRDNVGYLLSHFEAPEPVRALLVIILSNPLWNSSIVQEETKKAVDTGSESETTNDPLNYSTNSNANLEKNNIELSPTQLQMVHTALLDAFPRYDLLEQMLRFRLDLNINAITTSDTVPQALMDIISYSRDTGNLVNLINAAIESNPSNFNLIILAQALGIVSGSSNIINLEQVIKSYVVSVEQWRSNLSVIEGQVCRVEIGSPAKSYGTGFLIGPNLLMTAFHVVDSLIAGSDLPSDVTFRFDYKELPDSQIVNQGTVFRLAEKQWLVAFSSYDKAFQPSESELAELHFKPGLDFAVLRLAGMPGQESIGGFLESSASLRGWIDLNNVAEQGTKNQLLILHHPLAGPLQIGLGTSKDGMAKKADSRITYQLDTEPGSVGAPCFDLNWRPLAIHQSKTVSREHEQVWNGAGVLISAVLDSLSPHIREVILGIDKIESMLLPNRRILLDRKDLRMALREMFTVEGRKVLIVNGPRGSGKTYTKEFVYHVTQDIPNTKISTVNFNANMYDVSHLASVISISLGGDSISADSISIPKSVFEQLLKQLHVALIDIFPTQQALQEFTKFSLSLRLEYIAGSNNLSETLFNLIAWAESHEQLGKLIDEAIKAAPHSLLLRNVAEQLNESYKEVLSLQSANQQLIWEKLAKAALTEAFRNPGINRWLIIDDFDFVASSEQIPEFLYQLLRQAVKKLPQLRIILLGFTNYLPKDLTDKVLLENIQPIELTDIENFFAIYFKARNVLPESISIKNVVASFLIEANISLQKKGEQAEETKKLTKALNQWLRLQKPSSN